jgi:hypothetical protein
VSFLPSTRQYAGDWASAVWGFAPGAEEKLNRVTRSATNQDLVAYLSFGVPAIIAGLLIAQVGLLTTVLGYGVAIIVAAVAGLFAQLRVNRIQA